MGALQYVDIPGYSALICRFHGNDLYKSGGIVDIANEWLAGTDAHWNGQKNRWTFPTKSGKPSLMEFGHFGPGGMFGHSGLTYQYIGCDELTEFAEMEYRFLFRSLRRPAQVEGGPDVPVSRVPLRIRGGTNPIGKGAVWVKQRFITEGKAKGRVFVPSKLDDNPFIDKEAYIESLNELDPHMRALLLAGDWDAKPPGKMFRREWFKIIDEPPTDVPTVRFWDMAATEEDPNKPGKDPDWTVGVRMSYADKKFFIEDVRRVRSTPGDVEKLIVQTARLDGRDVEIRMEQEPGSSGKTVIAHYVNVLRRYAFKGVPSTGAKEMRAKPFSSQVQAGNVYLVAGPWNGDYLDELEQCPGAEHDDQMDGSSGAYNELVATETEGDIDDLQVGGDELPTPDW